MKKLNVLTLFLALSVSMSYGQNTFWRGIGDSTNIYRNGRVGIGISNPLNDLHVDGVIRITGRNPPSFAGGTILFGNSNHPTIKDNGEYFIEWIPSKGLNFGLPYPNPASKKVNIINQKQSDLEPYSLMIIDSNGKMMFYISNYKQNNIQV